MGTQALVAVGSGLYNAIKAGIEDRRHSRRERARLIEELESELTSAQLVEFSDVEEPIWTDPPRLGARGERRIYRSARDAWYATISWWRVFARRDARSSSRAWAHAEVIRLDAEAEAAHRAQYEFETRVWQGMQQRDPDAMLEVLEHHFADNAAPAIPVDCDGSSVSVVLLVGSPGDLPDRMCIRWVRDDPKLEKRTSESRRRLFRRSISSASLATVREAFAVTVGLDRADLLVASREDRRLRRSRLAPLCLASVARDVVETLEWGSLDPVATLRSLAELVNWDDETESFHRIELSGEPEAEQLLKDLERELQEAEDADDAAEPNRDT